MDFDAYLDDIPLLHKWGGKWQTGGFQAASLRAISEAIVAHSPHPRIIETGAGNTTITFLHLEPERLVTIAPEPGLRDRITDYCNEHGVPTDPLDFRLARSETELPLIAATDETFDVAFIDGDHGWPMAFVDLCYLNMVTRQGGLIFLDDIQLYSVGEISRLLEQQPGYELVGDVYGKVQIWRKDTDERVLPGHAQEPYIVERSNQAKTAPEPTKAASSPTTTVAHPTKTASDHAKTASRQAKKAARRLRDRGRRLVRGS